MDQNQIYDDQTLTIMRQTLHSTSNCIDIGCHAGVFLDEILKISPHGSHYGFEPLPHLYASLKEKYRDHPNVAIHNTALSDTSGFAQFQHVVSNPGYSGLKKRRYDRPNEIIQTISVAMERLDDVVAPNETISFIKIDVEGAEFQVLTGAKETIKRCRPVIIFEHGIGAADFYQTTPEMVFDLINLEFNLKCFTMEQWLNSNGTINLSRASFCDEFRSGRNYYFMAA